MKNIPFIQSVIASIVRVSLRDNLGYVEQLHGTGFFISEEGHLLTARHVIEKGQIDCKANGGFLAFFPQMDDGSSSQCRPIVQVEFAPEPFDIAICKVAGKSRTFYKLAPQQFGVWQDVAAAGYPMSVVQQKAATYEVHTRFHKGYIQRIVRTGDLLITPNPPAFEVSFPITQGMSGAPLFVYRPDGDVLIGVCVGSIQSSIVAYEETRIEQPGEIYREQVARIEEVGIAHNVMSLIDWRPQILGGPSLQELSTAVWTAV
jgi:hypothetical protein